MKETLEELILKSESLHSFINRKLMLIGQLYSQYSRTQSQETMQVISVEVDVLKRAETEKQIIDKRINNADYRQ